MDNDKETTAEILMRVLLDAETATPKGISVRYVARKITELVGPEASEADIRRELGLMHLKEAAQFKQPDDGMKPQRLSAVDLLYKDNAEKAKKASFVAKEAAPAKLTLTDEERAKVQKMSPDQKIDFFHAKSAAK